MYLHIISKEIDACIKLIKDESDNQKMLVHKKGLIVNVFIKISIRLGTYLHILAARPGFASHGLTFNLFLRISILL